MKTEKSYPTYTDPNGVLCAFKGVTEGSRGKRLVAFIKRDDREWYYRGNTVPAGEWSSLATQCMWTPWTTACAGLCVTDSVCATASLTLRTHSPSSKLQTSTTSRRTNNVSINHHPQATVVHALAH